MKKLFATSAIILALATGTAEAKGMGCWHGGMHKRMEEALSQLPKEKADMVRDTMDKSHGTNKAKWEQLRALRKEKRALVVAPTFDKEAYLAKVKQIQDLMMDSHTSGSAAFADALAQLNQEERQTLMDALSPKHKNKDKDASEDE